jgi:dihydropteroate synthase
MTYPQRASYTPIKGRLSYPVLVHASRKSFGRQDYEISTERDDGRIWVTVGADGGRLEFEDLTPAPGKE